MLLKSAAPGSCRSEAVLSSARQLVAAAGCLTAAEERTSCSCCAICGRNACARLSSGWWQLQGVKMLPNSAAPGSSRTEAVPSTVRQLVAAAGCLSAAEGRTGCSCSTWQQQN
jgi:hypothetical protein